MPSLREFIIQKLNTSEVQLGITILFGALVNWVRVATQPIRRQKYRRKSMGRRSTDRHD